MRRFEHPNGKFWAVAVEGTRLRIRWGEIGTPGQAIDRECNFNAAARDKERTEIVRQQRLGYKEVAIPDVEIREGERWFRRYEGLGAYIELQIDGLAVAQRRGHTGEDKAPNFEVHHHRSEDEARDLISRILLRVAADGFKLVREGEPMEWEPEGTTLAAASNAELEAQCRAAPEDAATYAVYADWLMQQNDPRGELAALQQRGTPIAEHLRTNRIALFGSGELFDVVEITGWRHGFPLAATLKITYDSELALDAATHEFLALPLAQFVEEVRFGVAHFESNNDWTATMKAITRSPRAPELRSVRFDAFTYADQEISWTPIGDFSFAWPLLPKLEELAIRSGVGGELGKLVLPRLKKFVRISGGLSAAELQVICEAQWPVLEHLELWLGTHAYNGQASTDRLLPILEARGLPNVRHLGLVNSEIVDSLISALASSPILRQLRTLDLSKGTMGSVATARLVEHAPRYAHLTAIDLTENCLTDEECQRLRAALPQVAIENQRGDREDGDEDHDEDDRFVAVGE